MILIGFIVTIPHVSASCGPNEDWPKAPCLDTLANGCYDANDVEIWMKYYDYKGEFLMESTTDRRGNYLN